MKFKIKKLNNYYYLGLEIGFNADVYIAKHLKLTKDEYQDILKLNGAINIPNSFILKDECLFKNKEDAKKVIEKLEPLLIMVELTGD